MNSTGKWSMDQNDIFFQWFSNCFDGIYRFFWVGLLFFWSFSIVMVIFRLGLEHLLSISRTSVVSLLADRDGPHLTFKILLLVQCSDGHAWSTTSSLRTNALWRFDRACDRMRGILSTTQPNSHTLYYSSIPKRNDRRKVSYLNTKPVYLKPVNSLGILIVMSEFGNWNKWDIVIFVNRVLSGKNGTVG